MKDVTVADAGSAGAKPGFKPHGVIEIRELARCPEFPATDLSMVRCNMDALPGDRAEHAMSDPKSSRQRLERPTLKATSSSGWHRQSVAYNPGQLESWVYRPRPTVQNAPLIVVPHGCTQTGRDYAQDAGWCQLADREGFVLLCPQQTRANNANLCFNWFETGDVTRGRGEVASMAAMVTAAVSEEALDPRRVFVTGLSAGGAMAGALLATYPELFAGGALIAGLPFGVPVGLQQALATMGHGGRLSAGDLGDRVRTASPHSGPWPRVSIWHGTRDTTVHPAASRQLAEQWAAVHGLTGRSTATGVGPHGHHVWRGPDGEVRVEHHTVTGMAHGTPLMTVGPQSVGRAGPYMLEVGRSSTQEIAAFRGLTSYVPQTASAAAPTPALDLRRTMRRRATQSATPPHPSSPVGVQAVIENALRSAGLMK